MLLWLMNLKFRGGSAAAVIVTKKGGAPVWLHHGGRHTAKLSGGRSKKSGK